MEGYRDNMSLWKIRKSTLLYYLIILMLFVSPFLTDWVPVMSNTDEMIAIISLVLLTTKFISKKLDMVANRIFISLLLMETIGIISTLISKVSPSAIIAFYDVIIFIKPYIIFLLFYSLDDLHKKDTGKRMLVFCKILVIGCSIYSFFENIVGIQLQANILPMLNNAAQRTWLSTAAMLIVTFSENNQKRKKAYIIIYMGPILVGALSGFGSILYSSILLFLYLFRGNRAKKIKSWQWAILAILAFIFAYEDISAYLFNEFAPRAILIRYGFITAVNYFPLGSGFASYGSEMAKRFYSKLYYKYGFDNVWSMSYQNSLRGLGVSTLNDVYLGMIVGQFGFIGLALYYSILYRILRLILNLKENTMSKAFALGTLLTISCSMIVSSNTTSSFGLCMFATLGLALSNVRNYDIQ